MRISLLDNIQMNVRQHVTACFMFTHQQKTGGTSGSKGKEHVSLVYIYIYVYKSIY